MPNKTGRIEDRPTGIPVCPEGMGRKEEKTSNE